MLPKIQYFKRFDASDLYAYKGGEKPKRQNVYSTPTEYDNVTSSSFGGPFGSGSSTLNKGTGSIDSTATLSPELQNSANLAQSGLTSNLGYINRNPQEQVNFATGGQDPYYNVLAEQAKQSFDNNLGQLRLQAFKGGGLNSTAAGAAYGNLAYNKNLYDNQILQSALQYGNQQATQNANTNLGAIGGLAQLVYPLESAANAQLNTSLQANDRADATTTQAKNAAEAQYHQAMAQYEAQKASQPFGGALGWYGNFIDPLGFSVDPGKATGQFAQIAGAAFGGPAGAAAGSAINSGMGNSVYTPNFGSSGGYSSLPQMNPYYGSPQFLNFGMDVA